MAYDIVWAPIGPSDRLAKVFGGHSTVSLPHLLDDPRHQTPNGGLQATLSAKTLSLGLLVTGGEPSPFVDVHATHEQIRTLLLLAAQDLQLSSEDQVCSSAAAYLRERHGENVALIALRNAANFVPNGPLTKGDLIVSLFMRATESAAAEPSGDLDESAEYFISWQSGDTSPCSNEKTIIYCGLAALTFLGRERRREAIIASHMDLITRSHWLQQELQRLRVAQPGHVSAIRLRHPPA